MVPNGLGATIRRRNRRFFCRIVRRWNRRFVRRFVAGVQWLQGCNGCGGKQEK